MTSFMRLTYSYCLLSSNQNTVVHRKWNLNVVFTMSHLKKIVGWVRAK